MSYNGSGTFVINSTGQPVVANTVISATVFNALTADLATGLSTAITKDGQTTITANIPFGSNKITALGAGTAATDAANLSQVQTTAAKLINVTGTDTITGTMTPQLTSYAAGQLFYFVAAGANTGAVTINIDGLGAKSITRDGSVALAGGDINSGEVVVLVYDGTRFQMINAANSFGNTTINGTLTVTGNTGLQANVSITSALSVGGTFNVTGAATLGSTLAVTGKSDLPTVSTASINAAVALITTGTVTNLTATGASIASANIGNLQFTAASIASINAGVAVVTDLTATSASIASANVGTAVITTGTVTNLTSTSASVASANAAVALITTGTVTNLTSTSASIASANVGTAVVTGLTVTGASIASVNVGAAVLSGNLTLNGGTANGVLYLDGSKVATSGSALTFDGTNLSNTGAAPNIRSTFTGGAYYTSLNADGVYASGTDLYLVAPASKFVSFYANNAEQMRLTSTGLGIGTTTPSGKVQITGASAGRYLTLNAPTDGGYITFEAGGTAFADAGSEKGLLGSGSATNFILSARSTNNILFATNNAERMRLDSSGNLGIGTTSPSNRLTASGTGGGSFTSGFTNAIARINATTNTAGEGAALALTALATKETAWILAAEHTSGSNGDLVFYGYPGGASYSERLRLNNAGNLGLGVTPSAWLSGIKAYEIYSKGNAFVSSTSSQSLITANAYYDAAWKYGSTAAASYYSQNAGVHSWYTAPSGTAGNAITFTTAMTLDASGNLGLGTTSLLSFANYTTLRVGGSSTTIGLISAYDGTTDMRMSTANNGIGYVGTNTNHPVVFVTNATERARITAGGYFKASNDGTYLESAGSYHEFRGGLANGYTAIVSSPVASPASQYVFDIRFSAATPNDTNARFLNCADATATRAYIRSNGGLSNYQSNNTDLSDARTKNSITPAASMWDKIGALEIVTYKYNDQTHDDVNVGVIAQQVEAVEPVWVDSDGWDKETPEGEEPLKTVYTKDITFAAIKALQEAMARIEKLEAEVAAMKGVA